MFETVLIANRGEIAVRIARTCHELGIGVVAVYSDADRTALHVRVADQAYRIGPSPARESYLNVEAILAAAAASGAQAIHPGYGFLAENAEFAERVAAAGLTFIGPPPAAIRAMGDKAAAKRLMLAASVPVVPGYEGEEQGDERLVKEADRIGYPLLIKASAGGGGRGMREVRAPAQFQEQLDGARREALAAFGDDTMLLERLIENARHVEVQIFGDSQGNVVHLGERDCSVQRRHQKVFEESPSPAVGDDLRRRMGDTAVRAARQAGYTNAGTVEFLLAENRDFYFLEMNTRLQVEHPVTEFVTGLDLVRLQVEVASGLPLPFDQAGVALSGHAIEVRLYAEDPANNYLPSTGVLARFAMPSGEGVRVDSGFSEGGTVSPYYDALLAKVIAGDVDREGALRRLQNALNETAVGGVTTNLVLLRAIASSAAFAAGEATIDFLDQQINELVAPPAVSPAVILGAAGFLLTDTAVSRNGRDPWQASGPWRVGGASRTLPLLIDGWACTVIANGGGPAGDWLLTIDGSDFEASFERVTQQELLIRRGAEVAAFTALETAEGRLLSHRGEEHLIALAPRQSPDVASASVQIGSGSGLLSSPMPGTIAMLNVAAGDAVKERQTLAVLEAMKMEHAIQATFDGRVKAVHCAVGERVTGGALLIELEPAEKS